MSIKNFLLKRMLKSQGVPENQIDMFVNMMEKDPALFKKIAEEIQAEIKSGKDKMYASISVMKKYESDLRKLM